MENQPLGPYRKTVLCLGNSHTFGAGAELHQSYPARLQQLFDKRYGPGQVRVINAGKIALNSSELLQILDHQLESFKPDFVILQTGEPNQWNRKLYASFLQRHGLTVPGGRISLGWDTQLRSVQFLRYILFGRPEAPSAAPFFVEMKDIKNSAIYRRFFAMGPGTPRTKALDKEITDLVVQLAPTVGTEPANSIILGLIYLKYFKIDLEALRWFLWSIEHMGEGPHAYESFNISYNHAHQIIERNRDQPEVQALYKDFLSIHAKRMPERVIGMMPLAQTDIDFWVETDLDEIIGTIKRTGAAVMLHSYPPYVTSDDNLPLNAALERVAKKHQLPFFDEFSFLKTLWTGTKHNKFDFYASYLGKPDYHLNAAGYEHLARGIFEFMESQGLLSKLE